MATSSPISGIHNYNTIPEKTKAILRLMYELNTGRRSGEEKGYVSSDDVRAYFCDKRL